MTVIRYYDQIGLPTKTVVWAGLIGEVLPPVVGPCGPAPSSVSVTPALFTQVLCDVGYAQTTPWSTTLLLPPAQLSQLFQYLAHRTQSVFLSVKIAAGQVTPDSFIRYLDSSDAGNLSYLCGQVAARMAADGWLNANGPFAFLHKSVYTNSALSTANLSINPGAEPDYLASTASGQWHAIEAKGGVSRYHNIRRGLEQLEQVNWVKDGAFPTALPVSRAVASVEIKRKLVTQVPWVIELVQIPPGLVSLPIGGGPALPAGALGGAPPGHIVLNAAVAQLTASAVQYAMLSWLPEAPEARTLLPEQNTRTVRRAIGDDALIWLPEPDAIKVFYCELIAYYLLRRQLRKRSMRVIDEATATAIAQEASDLCPPSFAMDNDRQFAVANTLRGVKLPIQGDILAPVAEVFEFQQRLADFRARRSVEVSALQAQFRPPTLVDARRDTPSEMRSLLSGAVAFALGGQTKLDGTLVSE